MTDPNNITNITNINLDSTLDINAQEGEDLAKKLNEKFDNQEGIENISYTNGQLEIKYTGDIDPLMEKIINEILTNKDIKDLLGEKEINSIKYTANADGTITLITNDTPITKKITDFDIRELMKLLIAVFSELRTADRERALNILNAIVATFEQKIAQMEIAKQEQFKAALATAIGQIAGGVITVLGAGIGAYKTSKNFKSNLFDKSNDKTLINNKENIKSGGSGAAGQFFSSTAMSSGQIITGIAAIFSASYTANKADADIATASLDQALEVLKQAQEQYTKGNDSLQQFIEKVLNVMMQLLQRAAQTEKAVANV